MSETDLIPKLRFEEYNDEWKRETLSNLADVKGGKRLPKGYSLINENNGFPHIAVSDMVQGGVDSSNIQYVPFEVVDKIKNYTISSDDVFVSVAGTLGIVGKILKHLNGANLTENADKITNLKINQDFLIFTLNSDVFKKLVHCVQTNNAQPKIALKEIRNMKISVPSKEEQEKIASFLSNIDSKIDLIQSQLNQIEVFKNGLLQQMFV